jgi:hypothetical protein
LLAYGTSAITTVLVSVDVAPVCSSGVVEVNEEVDAVANVLVVVMFGGETGSAGGVRHVAVHAPGCRHVQLNDSQICWVENTPQIWTV